MRHSICLIILLAISLIVSACAPRTAGINLSSSGETRIDDRNVARDVMVAQQRIRLVGSLLQGSAIITSQYEKDQVVEYRFTWFDAQGFAVDADSQSWTPVELHGKQRVQVISVAPNPQAIKFNVYVRKSHHD
ncbi:MAG: YcfL family protein [Parashewanella sp.]